MDEAMEVDDGQAAAAAPGMDTATDGSKVQVADPTLDLDAYTSVYAENTKLKRLLFIADHCPQLAAEALRRVVAGLGGTFKAKELRECAQRLAELCEQTGAKAEPVPAATDVTRVNTRAQETLTKLEADLKANRVFMVKETIRLGYKDLGDHHYATGNLTTALKQYQRCRDFSTASKHVIDMCINVIKVAIDLDNWVLVLSYVNKAQTSLEDKAGKTASRLNCYAGLAHLANRSYEEAARVFLKSNFEHCSEVPDVMSARDVAVYGGLCALASFDRRKLKSNVMENVAFKEFLDLCPEVRELIKDFYASRYSSCLHILKQLKPDMLLDVYLSTHITYLYNSIREKALIQYFSPFRSVDMHTMSKAFSCSVGDLETELIELITKGNIQARIDSDKKVLHARMVDQRTSTFADALELGRMYHVHCKAILLRAAMMKANLSVKGKERGGMMQGQMASESDFPIGGGM